MSGINTTEMIKPEWLRKKYRVDPNQNAVELTIRDLSLNTVCREAMCPNSAECFQRHTATFMILGTHCTRDCRFCNVTHGKPTPIDPTEPERVGKATSRLGLKYIVITSVTRDDLPDGGANHFAETVLAIKKHCPDTAIETLISDFMGDIGALRVVCESHPAVISHNMETVTNLYQAVRPQAVYERSLHILKNIKLIDNNIKSKTGVMLGLGETKEQIIHLMDDLRNVDCEILTFGQYLAPSRAHYPVQEFIHPDVFSEYKRIAEDKGFSFVASAPYVRSSYHAGEAIGL